MSVSGPPRELQVDAELVSPAGAVSARGAVDLRSGLAYDLVGATRSVVNATLKQFQRRGLIYPRRNVICFADRDGLRRLAESAESTL